MKATRVLVSLATVVSASLPAAFAQGLAQGSSAFQPSLHADSLASTRSSLGLNLGRDRLIGSFWGVELGYVDKARLFPGEARTQGMNLSLVGKAPLGESFGVFGKLGTNYGRADASVPGFGQGFGESSFGFAYGAGMSYSFTPRLSATLEWDSNDLRFMGAARDPVRSTSLGLRYRY